MAWIDPAMVADDTGVTVSNAYGKINHAEIDIPTKMARIDVHWFPTKEAVDKVRPFQTWSFLLSPEEMYQLLKQDTPDNTLKIAYTLVREGNKEKFDGIIDDV